MPKCGKMHSTAEFMCFWEKMRHFNSSPSPMYVLMTIEELLSALKFGLMMSIIMALILGPALLKKGREIFFLA